MKPVALRMVAEVHKALPELPILGIGGIMNADDVLEFAVAGASAVQFGTANFVDPQSATKALDALPGKLAGAGLSRFRDLVGTLAV